MCFNVFTASVRYYIYTPTNYIILILLVIVIDLLNSRVKD